MGVVQVLLVEDSPEDATLVERELRRLPGGACITRVDDEAAMREALARMPFDLVISDWSLPLFSGAAALEVRRELAPEVPFIIVSGDVGEDVAVAAMRAGAGDYVLKDKLRRLGPAIERELREYADRRARRTAEELLSLQDARFRALLEHSSDVITLTSADHRFTYVSPAVLTLLGYRPDELIGRACLDVVYPEDRTRVTEFLETLLDAPERPLVLQYRVVRRDGAVRWMEVTETNRLADRAVAGIIGNVRDITERREAHEQVKASERKYRRIIETTHEGVLVMDSSGRITFANGRMQEILGREPRTLVDRSIYEIVEPAGHAELSLQLEERRRGIRGFNTAALVHLDGTHRQVFIESAPILTDACEVEGVLAMISDVTARRKAEAALRVSETRFARLAETGIIGIAVGELDGRILDANDALLRLTGYRRDEVLAPAFHWARTSTSDWHERDLQVLAQLRLRGVVEPFEKELVRKDGTRVPVLIGVALVDARTGIVFVADLSAQKRAEAALVASEQQLRQAQKMEAMGRLAGGVAHDFNNVLSVILSYAEMLIEELAPGAARDDVGEIRNAAMRAGDLTQQLLLFGRTQQTATTLVDPGAVLAGMEKMLRKLVGEGVTLRLDVPPRLSPILIDKSQLEQVLMNLVINARDALGNGGELTISLAPVVLDDEFARTHHGVIPGDHIALVVRDTGCGIDEITRARMFEPFFTTKEVGKGTGLGLATVFGIVQRAGGTIWVDSVVSEGTTFTIYWPRGLTDARPELLPVVTTAGRGTETILLAEQEPQVRLVAAGILRRAGYTLLVAEDAPDAIRIAEQHGAGIDLLISDVVMPQTSGLPLAAQIRALRPAIALLHMSGHTDDTTRHGVHDAEGVFLQKPLTPELLRRKVREALSMRSGISG